MEEGLLSLKWNNHKSTFFHVLSILREKHTYTDVTLACDGRLYPAHKFVLSTCSEYFSDIFTSTSGNNIVIVLKDVRRQDLEYLLDYMYLGQVDVAQSELSSLIKTAECLRIKGLAIPDDEPQKLPRRGPEERDQDGSPPSKRKRHLIEEERTSSVSSSNTTCRIPHVVLPPPLPQSQQQQALLQRLQVPLPQPPQAPSTPQATGKSHPSPLPQSLTSSQISRTPQVPTSPHAATSTPQPHTPLSSPTQSTSLPVIKQEVTDPPEAPEAFMNESYDETETKPDVSDSRHLEQDVAVAGPSGLQGSSDNWDGDNDLASFPGGEAYTEGGMEEQGDSEVQGFTPEDLERTDGIEVKEEEVIEGPEAERVHRRKSGTSQIQTLQPNPKKPEDRNRTSNPEMLHFPSARLSNENHPHEDSFSTVDTPVFEKKTPDEKDGQSNFPVTIQSCLSLLRPQQTVLSNRPQLANYHKYTGSPETSAPRNPAMFEDPSSLFLRSLPKDDQHYQELFEECDSERQSPLESVTMNQNLTENVTYCATLFKEWLECTSDHSEDDENAVPPVSKLVNTSSNNSSCDNATAQAVDESNLLSLPHDELLGVKQVDKFAKLKNSNLMISKEGSVNSVPPIASVYNDSAELEPENIPTQEKSTPKGKFKIGEKFFNSPAQLRGLGISSLISESHKNDALIQGLPELCKNDKNPASKSICHVTRIRNKKKYAYSECSAGPWRYLLDEGQK